MCAYVLFTFGTMNELTFIFDTCIYQYIVRVLSSNFCLGGSSGNSKLVTLKQYYNELW